MKTIPAQLLADYALGTTTICAIVKVTLTNGTVIGFADHDEDVIVSGVTYVAARGAFLSDFEANSRMAIDNMEARGFYDAAVTQADLAAGLWDVATAEAYLVNWRAVDHGVDLISKAKIGGNTQEKLGFSAELRGLIAAYTQSIGRIVTPLCDATFGDARCGKALGPLTVTGTLSAVSADGLVLSDPARTEAGPTGPKAIGSIIKGTSTLVGCAGHGFVAGQAVYVQGVGGTVELNGQWHLVKAVVDANLFTLATDSSDYGTYTSGGTAAPAGDTGYFGGGKLTMTSGASNGLSMEVKSSSPGSFTLHLQLPRGVAAGDTYTLVAGCGHRFIEDCVGRYANGARFRGFPHVPGMDQMMEVGGS